MHSVTTIVTCMSDAERPFVAQSLRSVQRQTVPTGITLCVSDQNEWIDEVLAKAAIDVTVMRLPLQHAGATRNCAVATVESEYVAFLDSDDLWQPDKLRRQLAFLAAHHLDVVAAKHILIREDGTPFFFGFARNLPMTSSWLGRARVLRERPFDNVPVSEDVLLWQRLQSEVRCGIMDEFLIRYRVREVSLSSMTPTKERKLMYAHRSEAAGMRWILLGASFAANVGLRVHAAVRPRD